MIYWRHYKYRGLWSRSHMFEGRDENRVQLATCFPVRKGDEFGPVGSVKWYLDEGGDEEGSSEDRLSAMRAARLAYKKGMQTS